MRINARGIRFVGVGRAKCLVFIDLAPGNFELELGATLYARGNCEAIGCTG